MSHKRSGPKIGHPPNCPKTEARSDFFAPCGKLLKGKKLSPKSKGTKNSCRKLAWLRRGCGAGQEKPLVPPKVPQTRAHPK